MNTQSDGMKCLDHSKRTQLSFTPCESTLIGQRFFVKSSSDSQNVFSIFYVEGWDSMCLSSDGLKPSKCEEKEVTILWSVSYGMISSQADGRLCIQNFSAEKRATVTQCNMNESQYKISIMPQYKGDQASSVFLFNEDKLDKIFPTSVLLYGDDRYSSVTLREVQLPIYVFSTVEFKFRLLSTERGLHEICFDIIDGSGNICEEKCHNFINSTSVKDSDNTISFQLADIFQGSKLQFDGTETMYSVKFLQRGDGKMKDLRSSFHSIDIFNPVTINTLKKGARSLKIQVVKSSEFKLVNCSEVSFQTGVKIQDDDGNFITNILAAEKRLSLSNDCVTEVRNLPSGRRFRISLDPLDSFGNKFTDEKKNFKAIFEVRNSNNEAIFQ